MSWVFLVRFCVKQYQLILANNLEGKIGHFWCGVTLVEQTQLNKAWPKACGSLTREWTDFVATEEISLHIVTANGSVYANIWWPIPRNWIRINSARIESVEQNNPPHKTPLTTFVVVSFFFSWTNNTHALYSKKEISKN